MDRLRFLSCAFVAFVAAFSFGAQAETATARLGVVANAQASLTLTVHTVDVAIAGNGTSAGTIDLGAIGPNLPPPAGTTATDVDSTWWKLSGRVGIKVVKANSNSPSYTLKAQMTPGPLEFTFFLDGIHVSGGVASSTIATNAAYGTAISRLWELRIAKDTGGWNAFDLTMTLTAISN